jgi:hypothetical protein
METSMPRTVRTLLFFLLASALFVAGRAQAQQSDPAPSAPAPELEAAELFIFNDSGPTLIPGNQTVTDNGRTLASLPRHTYVRLALKPGPHVLRPEPPLWKQEVALNALAGNRYFVVVAYRPERSWATPLAGAPLLLREISPEEAEPLLREMKPPR